jgi:hypothetical protein
MPTALDDGQLAPTTWLRKISLGCSGGSPSRAVDVTLNQGPKRDEFVPGRLWVAGRLD